MSGFEALVRFAEVAWGAVTAALAGPHVTGVGLWLFAFVFLWAGSSKVWRPALVAMTLADLGVVRGVRPAFGVALGALEVSLAAWLMSGLAPTLATTAAAALLALFAAAVLVALLSGERVACMCFGDEGAPMSGWTLARTAALAAAAAGLAVGGVPPVARTGQESILEAVTAAALIAIAFAVSRLPRLVGWNPIPSFESEVET